MFVLVVEDEPLIAMHVESLLAQLDYRQVRCVTDVGRAFELLLERRPDFALLNVRLNGGRVFAFAAALRRRSVPIVFCSGLSKSELPVEWAAAPFVQKPLEMPALARAIAALNLAAPSGAA